MLKKTLRRALPDAESVRRHPYLGRFAHRLVHPALWHLNRRSAAAAVAVGLFCSLIPGPLQMAGAVIACLLLKVNLPVALASTLVTNPLTIVPIYLVAYRLGSLVVEGNEPGTPPAMTPGEGLGGYVSGLFDWFVSLGPPLAVGLPLLGVAMALTGWAIVNFGWRLAIVLAWRRRGQRRSAR